MSTWGPTILHVASLVRIQPSAYHKHSPFQFVFGQPPNFTYLRVSDYVVYVPITPHQRTKMSHQQRLQICIAFDSPSIISYLELLASDIFKVRFVNCHFDETTFLPLGIEKLKPEEWHKIYFDIEHLGLSK